MNIDKEYYDQCIIDAVKDSHFKSLPIERASQLRMKLVIIACKYQNNLNPNIDDIDEITDEIQNTFIWEKTNTPSMGYEIQEKIKNNLLIAIRNHFSMFFNIE